MDRRYLRLYGNCRQIDSLRGIGSISSIVGIFGGFSRRIMQCCRSIADFDAVYKIAQFVQVCSAHIAVHFKMNGRSADKIGIKVEASDKERAYSDNHYSRNDYEENFSVFNKIKLFHIQASFAFTP